MPPPERAGTAREGVLEGTCTRRGVTRATTAEDAAEDLFRALSGPGTSLVMVFCSAEMDLSAFSAALRRRFGDVPVIGCTTAGELGPGGYMRGGAVGLSLSAPDFHAASERIDNLAAFTMAQGHEVVRHALQRLERQMPGLRRDQIFAMVLIDGLSICEETVVSSLHGALGEIPLFGGSAADSLRFQKTPVLYDGEFRSNSAVFTLIACRHPFRVFKTEHFAGYGEKMVVTEADPTRRVVNEINAEPAAREYARLIGLEMEDLTPQIFAARPVVVRVGGMNFVRSIQKVNPDESLTFFCAIDEGIVLTLARGSTDITQDLLRLFDRLRDEMGPPGLVIGCDCILRYLELEQHQLLGRAGRIMAENNVIGFSTFGEQFQAMHVNQTFTGVAIAASGRS
ncbi:nitric oxide-sensing protein NosP [Telmatospirillum sp. J64-1]|uniref:nitric oxide-sensing protein NosP n=1 Tax=Telmatospirillum sp. J64-1 TaxID=2502183 RepID=UPI00115EC0FE|nr:nitric oxide-sensing protein NosP [Telmatospirillum sp. J64-1]